MPSGPSVLRIGVVDPVGSIDPRTMAEATTILLARQIFETPFQASAGGDALPALFQEKLTEEEGSEGLVSRRRFETMPASVTEPGSPRKTSWTL